MDKKSRNKVPTPNKSPKRNYRNIVFLLLLAFFSYVAYVSYSTPTEELESIPLSSVVNRANNGDFSKIEVIEMN